MRLFVLGESRFGVAFLRAAIAAGHEIVGAAATGPEPDHDPPAAVAALPANPIIAGEARPVRSSVAELLTLAGVYRILSAEVQECCPNESCYHQSLLPRHRGQQAWLRRSSRAIPSPAS